MGFVHSNGGQEPQDIRSVMTELNTVNEGFEAQRVELDEIVAKWRAGMTEQFTNAAQRLEARLPFVEDGTVLLGLSGSDRVQAIGDLLSVFKNQREFVAPMLADFPDTSASRLMVVLNKLIRCLEREKREVQASLKKQARHIRLEERAGFKPSRRMQAKQMRDEFLPPSSIA